MSQKVTAVRNGVRREFTKQVWDALPENKNGWKQQKSYEIPDELKSVLGDTKDDSESEKKVGTLKPRKRTSKK